MQTDVFEMNSKSNKRRTSSTNHVPVIGTHDFWIQWMEIWEQQKRKKCFFRKCMTILVIILVLTRIWNSHILSLNNIILISRKCHIVRGRGRICLWTYFLLTRSTRYRTKCILYSPFGLRVLWIADENLSCQRMFPRFQSSPSSGYASPQIPVSKNDSVRLFQY